MLVYNTLPQVHIGKGYPYTVTFAINHDNGYVSS